MTCVLAYVIGFPGAANERDGVPPRIFIPDLVARQGAAISNALEALIQAGEINLIVRVWKRALVVVAILLLLAAAVVVTLARLSGNVVQ